jgi:hypothetical protein
MGIFNIGPASAKGVSTVASTSDGLKLEGMLWDAEHSGIAELQIALIAERPDYAGYIN